MYANQTRIVMSLECSGCYCASSNGISRFSLLDTLISELLTLEEEAPQQCLRHHDAHWALNTRLHDEERQVLVIWHGLGCIANIKILVQQPLGLLFTNYSRIINTSCKSTSFHRHCHLKLVEGSRLCSHHHQ